jgi:acyl-coenzyme A thioesterase PaaI-like protein
MSIDPKIADQLRVTGWTLLEDEGFVGLVGPMWLGPVRGQYGFLAEEKHKNRGGAVMGGMLMTFADRAMGSTSRKVDRTIASQATVHMDFDFVDAVEIGEFVVIACEVVRQTKTLIFMRGTLSCGERRVGTTSGIWKIKKRAA